MTMNNVDLKLTFEQKGTPYLIEQGIPVFPMEPAAIANLRLIDENNNAIPANIEADGRDENAKIVWVRVTTAVDSGSSGKRRLALADRPEINAESDNLNVVSNNGALCVESKWYKAYFANPGNIMIETENGLVIDGDIKFQLWPDARSIVGGGAGTCRLAQFEPLGWRIEEQTDNRCLVIFEGRVRKYRTARLENPEWHEGQEVQFDCELELIFNSFSPVVRYKWRINNHTIWQAYLERYAIVFPLAGSARIIGGEESDDGKFLRYINAATSGGTVAFTANFIDKLGKGAGINAERREVLHHLTIDEVSRFAGDGIFEPHKYLSAREDLGNGLDVVLGGINPPQDGCMTTENPQVHRLFYLGMGRTFDGSILINCNSRQIYSELNPVYFEIDPNHYSRTGVLPEQGDEVCFGEYKDSINNAAEWMLKNQWTGTLWWGEWWREYDVYREQGVEATANGNSPLGPLYHYWRTGDARFIQCAKNALEYVYDIQLCKRRVGLAPFFQCRRFMIDKMEWIHMRYQRIEGPIKAAHFFGDRRLRQKILDAMTEYARKLVCPNGAPGYGEGGVNGRRVPAGADCTNFGETLIILYKETGNAEMSELAKKMARWTIRTMKRWDWNSYVGNSYGWHFLMRGMLQTLKITRNKRMREWYLDMARKNMSYSIDEIEFVLWMDWLIVEAQRLSGENWLLDVLKERTNIILKKVRPNGNTAGIRKYPESEYPTYWWGAYDAKNIVSYIPVLTARRKALGLD